MHPIIGTASLIDLPFVPAGIKRISDLLDICKISPSFGIIAKYASTRYFFQQGIMIADVSHIALLRQHNNIIEILFLRSKIS
ncbi:hypothetical protein ASF16_22070 [Acidovorax sp. Leaf78]|nr:hypothetical protein ASF16_22070 [Acidovorax sp. Leaf78]